MFIWIEEPDPEIEGVELFQSKAARIVLAPKWRVIFEGWIWVLLTHLFDPNLKVISQHDKTPACWTTLNRMGCHVFHCYAEFLSAKCVVLINGVAPSILTRIFVTNTEIAYFMEQLLSTTRPAGVKLTRSIALEKTTWWGELTYLGPR